MGTVSQKLEYLNETKGILKDVINYSDAGITSETTFRNYAAKLYDGYVDILKNKYVLLDNMPKGQVEGISAVINNAEDLPVYNFKFTKESTQDTSNIIYKCDGTETGTYYFTYNSINYEFTMPTITSDDVLVFNIETLKLTLNGVEILTTTGTSGTQLAFIATPNPEYPQEVNVVEGYRNLFDKDNANILNAQINSSSVISAGSSNRTTYINAKPNTTYTITKLSTDSNFNFFVVGTTNILPRYNETVNQRIANKNGKLITITTDSQTNYLVIWFYNTGDDVTEQQMLDSIMIVEGTQELPYVPYGNNYIAVNVSDGTNTNKYPIPLNNNIIVGIGDYKDELIVDKSGNVFINKKTGKIIFDGNTNTFPTKSVSVNNIAYVTNVISDIKIPATATELIETLSSHFINKTAQEVYVSNSIGIGVRIDKKLNVGFELSSTLNTVELVNEWLNDNNVILYYPLAEPQLIDLNTKVDLRLFKGTNNISNSEDGLMNVEYVKEYEEA